ncbi:unnamed protein product [Thlaspi arvense]|uniref:F-box domain-containing protein n=1 Tax=Thlaspi arvense TaxID=13288 RepID=A0AAU9RUX1_THLAR|nr:unnamed protein product [Thlaspi arvense]
MTESGEGNPNPLTKISKIETEMGRTISDAILVEILARLPLRTIARFKLVCIKWKSEIESPYFRRLFVSVHRSSPSSSSSSSWSLMFALRLPITEAIGFHGCNAWDLPKSLASYISPFERYSDLLCHYVASSNGLVWIDAFTIPIRNSTEYLKSFVGNPVLQQWVEIPPPPSKSSPTGLVTRVENGAVSSFKVVRTKVERTEMGMMNVWSVYVYSSETGLWTFKRIRSSCRVSGLVPALNLDGKLYMWDNRCGSVDTEFGVLVGYDFYAEKGDDDDDQCRVIPFPLPDNKYVRRCLTTSRGDVLYVEILYRREEIDMASVGFDVFCFPLAMNPYDADIIYLWSRQHECLVSGNLRTLEFIVHQESENWSSLEGCCCRINKNDSKSHMIVYRNEHSTDVIVLSQFVLPPWMGSVPRPPQIC